VRACVCVYTSIYLSYNPYSPAARRAADLQLSVPISAESTSLSQAAFFLSLHYRAWGFTLLFLMQTAAAMVRPSLGVVPPTATSWLCFAAVSVLHPGPAQSVSFQLLCTSRLFALPLPSPQLPWDTWRGWRGTTQSSPLRASN